jgi:integrase
VIRVTGRGLFVQEHTKTIAGMRTIRPPDWVMAILKRRHAEHSCGWMFPSSTRTLRQPDNTRKAFGEVVKGIPRGRQGHTARSSRAHREVVKGTPFEGLHPRDFRHYVAGVLDDAGLTAQQIADYLGHELVSTTQEEYMERGVVGEQAGPALADRPEIEPPKTEG